MESTFQILLNLPDVRVLSVSKTKRGEWIIHIESTLDTAICKRCGREIEHLHCLGEPIRLRHLPVFDQPVFLQLQPKRYRCLSCEGRPTTTQRCAWYDERSPNTHAYEQMVLRLLVNSTLADTAAKLSVSEETVQGILQRYIDTSVDWDQYSYLGLIGIDEVALKKGHRDYVAIITTPRTGGSGVSVLGVLADRKKETVKAFLRAIPARLRRTISRVCTDMNEGYARAIEEEVSQAKVIVDRFHVARAYRECADQVRKREMRRLKKEVSEQEYAQELSGVMWPFRKGPKDLEHEERELLHRVFARSPRMARAYELREQMTAIFERDLTKAQGKRLIEAWCNRVRESGLSCFEPFLKTVGRWQEEITNYFDDRESSGFVEGFNNRVKVLKRRCYGIFDVGRIFQRLHLDLEGYRLFGTIS